MKLTGSVPDLATREEIEKRVEEQKNLQVKTKPVYMTIFSSKEFSSECLRNPEECRCLEDKEDEG